MARTPLIICFGDSLTVGYQSPTPESPQLVETPYGRFLQERLGPRATVAVSGICGEVTGDMVLRFRQDVLRHDPASVVVLGGSNDLGWRARPAEIMRNLLKMYALARAAGIRLVAVTVPSVRLAGGVEELIAQRQSLNRLIGEYCFAHGVACVDLFTATADPTTLELAAECSNDGLHLTTEGYRRLATLLYDQIFAPAFGNVGRQNEEPGPR
ncbi:MAG: SGNH/GDSL hydrolase family protein [Nitrospiraceae bacterium]